MRITEEIFNELKSKLIEDDKISEHELVVCLSEITYEFSKNTRGEIEIERI